MIKEKTVNLQIMKPNQRKISTQDKKKLVASACVTFIIGFAGVGIISLFTNTDENDTAQAQAPIETVQESQPKKHFDDSKVQEFKSQLESDNLLYVYVDNMYEWLQDSINASHCDSTFINLVNGYHDIVTMLGEGKLEEVIQYQNEHQVLSDNHLWQIRAAYKGWRDESGEHEYDANSSKEAKAQFERDYKDIVSFNEIYMIHEGKTEIAE